MKRLISILLVCVMVVPFGMLSSLVTSAETITVPAEPTVEADAPVYYIGHKSVATGDGSSITSLTSSEGWSSGGNMYEKAAGGAIFVIGQKGYIGAAAAYIKPSKPVVFTALDPATGESVLVKNDDGSYITSSTAPGQLGMFMKDTNSSYTDEKNSFFIQGPVIFENTAILQRTAATGIYHVENGGSLVIKETCDIIYGSAGKQAPKLVVDAGGYAYLHNAGFSSYSGNGTIVVDRALIDSNTVLVTDFIGFNGTVCDFDGNEIEFPRTAVVPELENKTDVAYFSFSGDNNNAGTSASDMKKNIGNAWSLLPNGGTLVIPVKGYISSTATMEAKNGTILITAKDPQTEDMYYAGPDTANSTQAGMIMLAAQKTLTFKSDVIFQDIAILQRDCSNEANAANYLITNGATMVIGDNVDFLYSTTVNKAVCNSKLTVDAGAKLIVKSAGALSYNGEGTIYVDRSLIGNGITADQFTNFTGALLDLDGKALCELTGHKSSVIPRNHVFYTVCSSCGHSELFTYTEPAVTSTDEFYWAYDGSNSNDGASASTPVQSSAKLSSIVNNGGTVYVVGKANAGASVVMQMDGTTMFTAVGPDGTDYRGTDFKGQTHDEYGALMWSANVLCTETYENDTIFKDINIYNRNKFANVLAITNNSTALFENVVLKTSADTYPTNELSIEAGSVVIMKGDNVGSFSKITGMGTLIVDMALVRAGKLTAEQLTEFDGAVMTTDCKEICALTGNHTMVDGTCTECGYSLAKVSGYTITLGDSIGVNFYVKLDAAVLADASAKMLFTLPNGSTSEVPVAGLKETTNGYKFTCNVAAKQMTDEITAQVITTAGKTQACTYTVEAYAKTIIANTATFGESSVKLAKALLNYGATAQLQLNYNGDKLANASLAATAENVVADADMTVLAAHAKEIGTAIAGVTYAGSSTVWEDRTRIRHYFTVEDGAELTFMFEDETLTLVQSSQKNAAGEILYYVDIFDILPQDFSNMYVLKVNNGSEIQEIKYSVYSYLYDVLYKGIGGETMANAAKAAYHYCVAATEYFGDLSGSWTFASFTASDSTVLPYQIYTPTNMDPEKKYPVLLFMHGMGSVGTDGSHINATVAQILDNITYSKYKNEVIIIAPQHPSGSKWVNVDYSSGLYDFDATPISQYLKAATELFDQKFSELPIDTNRVYGYGNSMGAFATGYLAMYNPELYAAIVGVAGGYDPTKAELIKDIPAWFFHGDADTTVDIQGTNQLVANLQELGANVKYTVYNGVNHATQGCFVAAANTEGLLDWLFAQSKK